MEPALTAEEIEQLTAQQLVNKLWDKRIRNRVIRCLIGALSATEMKTITEICPEVKDALFEGLQHWSPPVRWWSLQLIDHTADETMLQHVGRLLNDPVQRIRKQAEHALTCEACKPDSSLAVIGRKILEDFRASQD
jgi:hypothetical protein